MNDDSFSRPKVASPCVQICVVHPAERICTGCFRTIDEITRWQNMDPAERADIINALPARAPRLAKRRGGRAARLLR